jgi:membrane-associated phospholipid phosphatase
MSGLSRRPNGEGGAAPRTGAAPASWADSLPAARPSPGLTAAAAGVARAARSVNAVIAAPPRRRSVRAFRQRPLVYTAMAVYAVASMGLMATRHVGLTSEHIVILCLVAFAAAGRARPFVWDWLPFVFVAVMFEDLTGAGARIAGSVHVVAPILLEKSLFGGVVWTWWLQEHLDGGLVGRVLGLALAGEYLFHFAAPLVAGLWLWLWHRERFGSFVGAYILVMAAGFLVYLLYPEMPPWLAAQTGRLPPVHRIVVETLQGMGSFGTLYAGADPEPNAAMPSLHVAVPMVIACAAATVRGVRRPSSWLWLLYPVTISFGVVYLGEHYVADVLVGLALGVTCHVAAVQLGSQARRPRRALALTVPAGHPDQGWP